MRPVRETSRRAPGTGALFAALLATAAGCAASAPTSDGGVVDTRPQDQPSGEASGRTTTEPRSASDGASPISSSFHLGATDRPKIGATCEGADPTSCGSARRVAIERNQVAGFNTQRELGPPPCAPRRLVRTNDMNGRSFCVDGAYLYAREDCGPCRIPSYREVVAKLDELTAEQRQEVAKLLGIEGRPPVGADEWRDVLDRRVED